MQTKQGELVNYYRQIQDMGGLMTLEHAERWSAAVLKILGVTLSRSAKKTLGKALPEPLTHDLNRTFRIFRFDDNTVSRQQFLEKVARVGGNSDYDFALKPTTAVFHHLKEFSGQQVSKKVADGLAPELGELWLDA